MDDMRRALNNIVPDIFDTPDKKRKKLDIFVGYKFDNKLVNELFEKKLKPLIEDLFRRYSPIKDSVSNPNFKFDKPVMDNILRQIDNSRMAIIDLTDHSYNVYYEAGILFGKKIPIIFTAHSKKKESIPFDINEFHVFYWDENEENKFLSEVRQCILSELD